MHIEVTEAQVLPGPVINALGLSVHGAVVTFMGTVRRFTGQRVVRYLDYEAYPEMAAQKLHQVGEEAMKKFWLEDIAIVHRIGKLYVGETSLIVAVGSAHRREGFEACLYSVERIKEIVPIWKKEVWDVGAVWVNSEKA